MNTLTRRIGVALTAALLATTAIAPMASARQWPGNWQEGQWQGQYREAPREWHGESHRRDDNGAGLALGLGLAAIAGIAILSSAHHAAEPVYQPAYPVYPSYAQPAYSQPAYAQPTCTTINGAAACIAPDGTWQYVR